MIRISSLIVIDQHQLPRIAEFMVNQYPAEIYALRYFDAGIVMNIPSDTVCPLVVTVIYKCPYRLSEHIQYLNGNCTGLTDSVFNGGVTGRRIGEDP